MAYIVAMTYFLFWGDDRDVMIDYRYNLEPFKEIMRFYKFRNIVGIYSFILNIAGNILAFMPFGFLIPIVVDGKSGFFKTSALSFLFTLCIEITQLVTKLGVFDVDDIILNTCGGVAGYIFYTVYRAIRKEKGNAFKKK